MIYAILNGEVINKSQTLGVCVQQAEQLKRQGSLDQNYTVVSAEAETSRFLPGSSGYYNGLETRVKLDGEVEGVNFFVEFGGRDKYGEIDPYDIKGEIPFLNGMDDKGHYSEFDPNSPILPVPRDMLKTILAIGKNSASDFIAHEKKLTKHKAAIKPAAR